MAVHMVKVAYEGAVTKALKSAEAGLTNGGAIVYEVEGVPASVTLDEVIEAVRLAHGKPPHKDYVVAWADLAA